MDGFIVTDSGGRAIRVENDTEGRLWPALGCDPERRRWLGVFRGGGRDGERLSADGCCYGASRASLA